MVGDRMDTDVKGGMEAGMETVLVLSGTTTKEEIEKYAYRPTRVVNSVADIEAENKAQIQAYTEKYERSDHIENYVYHLP
eukprot:g71677.t1